MLCNEKYKSSKSPVKVVEWEEIIWLVETASLKSGTYIKRISLNGKINVIDLNEVTPVMNALRIIGNNINQIAKKANEINSIYASDIEDLKEDYEDICHTLNLFLSTLPSTAA